MKLLLSLALLLPAYAQTLIRDVDKPGLRPYQVTVTADAKADSEVWLNFPAPPAGKRLVLEHATLHIALWADQSVACELSGTVASVQGTQAAVHHFGPAQLVYATHSDSYFRINQPLRFESHVAPPIAALRSTHERS